jgi:hypothetical protein
MQGLNMESKTIPSGDVIPLELLLTSRMKALGEKRCHVFLLKSIQ